MQSFLHCTLLLPVSCGLHVSLLHSAFSEPSNAAADSGDGCLHCGKYEIKRKGLLNWQQAPQDREAGDGMINLTWDWSAGLLRRDWWIYSVVWKSMFCFVCSLFHVYILCLHFFKAMSFLHIVLLSARRKWINRIILVQVNFQKNTIKLITN